MRRQSEGHSESHMDSSSAPFAGGLTEVSHLVIENEKLRRKLKKVQQRRDHYARLYYRILADFDETKWELTVAKNKIREMKSQAVQDQKPPPPPPPLHPHLLLRSSSGPHPQQTHVSGSTTTSPDSGTSMSPKIQQVAQNPFLHQQQQQQQQYRSSARSARSKSLPRNLSNKISDAPRPPPPPSLINYKNGMVMKYGHEVPVPTTTTRNETDSDSHSHTSRNARQLPKPPREAFIQGPNSYHHHHNPLFPQKRPLDRCASLSQGDSSSMSYSGPLVSFQKIPPHQKQAFALSQESYVPSPPIFRKTTFERTMSQPQAGSRKSHSMRSALKRPAFERTSLSQDDTISECDHISAFRKPITRKMSQPLAAAEGYHHHHHNPPSTASQHHSSPPIHSSHHHHHPHTLTGLQQLPLPHPTLSQTTSSPQQFDGYSVSSFERSGAPSPSTISRVSVTSTTTCTSVGTPACCNYTSRPPPSQDHSYEGLTGVQLLDLMARISDPACTLTKLEVSNSQLGKAEAMGVFCEDLLRNKSVIELSLPNNGINCESLKILLDCIEHCDNIKELMLRNNQIGQDCAEVIKQFLTKTNLDSLVLTGNEIEQYGHLLNGGLPSDFTMEYDTTDGSEDSGLAVGESENAFSSSRPSDHSLAMHFKYLHI